MKKELILGLGLALASPLVLAQTTTGGSSDRNQNAATPATPAVPATPALPSTDPNSNDTGISGPSTDSTGTTSGSARMKNARGGASANPNSGHGSAYGSGGSDFGSLDTNGDGRISRDELKANAGLAGQFDQLDKNSDGSLSRAEYSMGLRASPSNQGGGGSSDTSGVGTDGNDSNSAKGQFNRAKDQGQKNGDKAKKDANQKKDDLDRKLNGGG